jgi:hypothetical protein
MTNHTQKSTGSQRISALSLSLIALSMLCSGSAYSQQTDKERIKSLEQRLLELEQQVQKKSNQSSTVTKDTSTKRAY